MGKLLIVDCGLGNFGSVQNMLKRLGCDAGISADPSEIATADRLILPGVGAYDTGMGRLRERGLEEVLRKKALVDKVPILGICLGMQLMGIGSDEGNAAGLGWVDVRYKRFDPSQASERITVPHMGWNFVQPERDTPLFRNVYEDLRFYFVHSFHAVTSDESLVIGRTEYGYSFISAIQQDNLLGCQFHPEKSHKYGMQLLTNFMEHY